MSYLKELNSAQRKAVLHRNGPLLILAGAGAGKTRTITYRILHLIKNGVTPENILAVTFTNKAAKEMKERITQLIHRDKELNLPLFFGKEPFVKTFHSLGVYILRENFKTLGIPKYFSIFDKNNSQTIVKEILLSLHLDPKQFEPKKILGVISRQKGNFTTVSDYSEKIGGEYFPQIVATVWQKYEKILAREKALDFDDLLLKTALLLNKNKEILNHYQNKWQYIHIDEYQDTNKVQYKIARLLSQKRHNICVVGDTDQNIYSWRGANIQNILNFEKDFANSKTILLEENYRSTQNILLAANEIISKNKLRQKKTLFTKNMEGEKLGVCLACNEADEANFVAQKSNELITDGVSPKEIAVLYRTNFQSRILEEAFLNVGVPYQVLGTKFFERKEIKDILAFIKSALNPKSLTDLKRIINVPPRGMGKITLLKIFSGEENDLNQTTQAKLANFRNLLEQIKETALNKKPSELIKFVIKETGLEDKFKSGTEDDLERLANIKEFVSLALKYDNLPVSEGMEKLLEEAALATDQDQPNKKTDAVRLMTVHSAKGLEFNFVFVTGLEDGLFPSKMMDSRPTQNKTEEERRLFYVALTRARRKLFLSYASVRTIFGARRANIISEFITDISDDLLEYADENTSLQNPSDKIEYLEW